MNLIKPNLFIVGAAKSGTTTLHHLLGQHPDIFLTSLKEPHFFCKDYNPDEFLPPYDKKYKDFSVKNYLSNSPLKEYHGAFIKNIDDYLELFRESKNEAYLGEATPVYLKSECAAKNIYEFNNESKIIIILRNPVDRAFSQWHAEYIAGYSNSNNFLKDCLIDFEKPHLKWGVARHYIRGGLYYQQIKRYLNFFKPEQIKIVFLEDLKESPKSLFNDILNFLELRTENIQIDYAVRRNVTMVPKNYLISKLLKFLRRNYRLRDFFPIKIRSTLRNLFLTEKTKPKAKNSDIKSLIPFLISDIQNIEKLCSRDLKHWKK